MTGAAGGAAAAAAAAAVAAAIKAHGAIIRLEVDEFKKVLYKCQDPLVVIKRPSFMSPKFQYLITYKGMFFFTKSAQELLLPGDAETILTKRIWIPQG